MKFDICTECVFRREQRRVCTFCDEGSNFEEDPTVKRPQDSGFGLEQPHDDGDQEGFGL